ncbi:hypothetical protein CEY16_00360 [Halalkalibacillus sediminis]|uniref:SpoVR protein-like N-terminal domain-containing protein n=1 Tax=Halalkalibacillus sediminis TaxID=2018042 RepID=A0A2I0QV95_9BACI|nr:SpoVR family protein [Halalkalibacillus sediminis]PKR78246.1 hypothetical protein CEY16_00360 [Halalkalibacillus sediminis]
MTQSSISLSSLLKAAGDLGVSNIDLFDVQYLSNKEMNILQKERSSRRIFHNESFFSNDYNAEQFEWDANKSTVYLNENNSPLLNTFVLAHSIAHQDFFQQNKWFQARKIELFRQRFLLKGFIKRTIADYGKDQVKETLYHLQTLSTYQYTALHEDFFRELKDPRLSGFVPRMTSDSITPYLIHHSTRMKPWQKELAKLLRFEEEYYFLIKLSRIANEGWATFWQRKILLNTSLTTHEKLQFQEFESRMMELPCRELNVYSLGKKLWEQVPQKQLFSYRKVTSDFKLLTEHYNRMVHETEKISIVSPGSSHQLMYIKDYDSVKKLLIDIHLFNLKPIILLDKELTYKTGHITMRWMQGHQTIKEVKKVRSSIEFFYNGKVYMKPFECANISSKDSDRIEPSG